MQYNKKEIPLHFCGVNISIVSLHNYFYFFQQNVHHRKIIRPSKILAKKWTMKLTKVVRKVLHTYRFRVFSSPLFFVHTTNYYVKVLKCTHDRLALFFWVNGFMFCRLARWSLMEGNAVSMWKSSVSEW